MGDVMMGSAKHTGNAPLMTKEQQNVLAQILQGAGPQANQALMSLLGGGDPQAIQDMFQQAYIDPAMLAYEQDVLPAIQQRFADADASSSSALNQALGRSARDLSTMLGSQMGQFWQNQQMNQLNALGVLNQTLGQRAFDPIIQQRQGLAGPLIGAAGTAAGGYLGGLGMGAAAASSKHVKENIEDYHHGLDHISKMKVKQYDYKAPFEGKGKVGLIAEDVPEELQADVDGVLGVDLYGLLSTAIKAIQELTNRVEALEAS